MELIIKPFSEKDVDALATHINESSEAWPGAGLNHGVSMEGERVREWFQNMEWEVYLAWFEGKLVGFSSLTVRDKEQNIAYIPLLNVVPSFHGRGIGRHLLRHSVNQAVAKGYRRLDLGTWPGNLKAVPLYKKTGFFWRPNTGVHMESYLPLLLQNPIVKQFFARRDWYDCFKRDLSVKEDVEAWRGMDVYTYRWQDSDDFLEVKVDRESEGITCIKSSAFCLEAWVDRHQCPVGVENRVHWRLDPGDNELSLLFQARGEDGLELAKEEKIQTSEIWEAVLPLAPQADVRLKDKDERAHMIETQIIMNDEVQRLQTGIRLTEVLAVAWPQAIQEVQPARIRKVSLNLQNHLQTELRGKIVVAATRGLEVTPVEENLVIPPAGYSGVELLIKGETAGFYEPIVLFEYEYGGRLLAARPQKLPIFVRQPGRVVYGKTKDNVYMVNDRLVVKTALVGGKVYIYYKPLGEWVLETSNDLLGPPFSPPALAEVVFEAEYKPGELLLRTHHPERRHLQMEKRICLCDSCIHTTYQFYNYSARQESFQVRAQGFVKWFLVHRMTVPIDGYILTDEVDMDTFPAYNNLPQQSRRYTEKWQAYMGEGFTVGTVAPPGAGKCLVDDRTLLVQSVPVHLHGHEEKTVPGPTFYVGPGDWREIANLAAELAGRERIELPGTRLLEPHWQNNLTPVLGPHCGQGTLELFYPCRRTRAGEIQMEYPREWQRKNIREKIKIDDDHPVKLEVDLTPPTGEVGIAHLDTKVKAGDLQRREVLPFIIPQKNGACPVITEEGDLWHLQNGLLEIDVAPSFSGAATGLRYQGREFIDSPYPQVGVCQWINPWYGGITPVLVPAGSYFNFPGYLHQERFVCKREEVKGQAGLIWAGIGLEVKLKRTEFQGLELNLSYLTMGGSPFLALVFRIKNRTEHYFKVNPLWAVYWQPSLFETVTTQDEDRCLNVNTSFRWQKDWLLFKGKKRLLVLAGKAQLYLEEFLRPHPLLLQAGFPKGLHIPPQGTVQTVTYICFLDREQPPSVLKRMVTSGELF